MRSSLKSYSGESSSGGNRENTGMQYKRRGAESARRAELFLKISLLAVTCFWIGFPFQNAYASEEVTFEIKSFTIEGNTLFENQFIQEVIESFKGLNKTAEDVEKARDRVEKFYHRAGYPTVLVNIPEQSVDDGVIRLQVIESRIRRVRITGNRYFTMEKILRDLPSFKPGEILYVPRIKDEIEWVNRSEDLNVTPVLMPARELGRIDVELKVKDSLPLHGSLEVNNRSTHDTTDLRVNTMLRYANLWQKDHSVSLQYQTSPEDLDEVQVIAASYVLPSPFNDRHMLALYGLWSDSDTAFGEGFEVIGEGFILGTRYVIPLPSFERYSHSVTLGLDYKDFEESTGFGGVSGTIETPVRYMPLSLAYNSALRDKTGLTTFTLSANLSMRGFTDYSADKEQFGDKRAGARGNYIYLTAGMERTQKLPKGLSLFLKVDGQVADQPLISNEQYSAGGMESVRGYKESEALGDNALHASGELISPDIVKLMDLGLPFRMNVYGFYDFAALKVKDPEPEQDEHIKLQGFGLGVRGSVKKYVEYDLSWGIALTDTDRVDKGNDEVNFRVKFMF